MGRVVPWVAVLGALTAAPSPSAGRDEIVRLEFSPEIQNLRVVSRSLRVEPPAGVRVCPTLSGERRWGAIPLRAPDASINSTEGFLHLVVAYAPGETPPRALADLNRDGELACGEILPLLTDPSRPGKAFRTLRLPAPGGGQGPRMRITVPWRLEREDRGELTVDRVDVPVARWTAPDGTKTRWLLHDGNFNGLHDRRFGDGLLIDVDGDRTVRTDPGGPDFFSYHLPLELPWGRYEVVELDPAGRWLTLRPLAPGAGPNLTALEPGGQSETLECPGLVEGGTVRLGGATGRHQLLFFWLSHCGSCAADAGFLRPVLETLGRERLVPVGVSLDEDAAAAREFAAAHALAWGHCFSGTGAWDNAVARRFGITAPSSFVLIDPEGRILHRGVRFETLLPALQRAFPDLGPT